jgi:hypothetical protein
MNIPLPLRMRSGLVSAALVIAASAGISLMSSRGQAHPVSYKGALSVMGWNQPELTRLMSTYTFRWDAAVAVNYLRLVTRQGERHLSFGQINYLVHRWTEDESQANLYVYGGLGNQTLLGQSNIAGLAGEI